MYEYYDHNKRPLPALSGSLSRESRRLIAGLLALSVSLLENRMHFRLFPIDTAWAAIVLCGWPIVSAALRRKSTGAETVLSLGLGITILSGHIPVAGILAVAFRIALDQKDRIGAALRRETEAFASSLPDAARLVGRGGQSFVSTDSLQPGDLVRVLPGETVPVDGIVVSGTAAFSTAALNGAVLPLGRQPGGHVPSGAAVTGAPFTMKAEASAFNSTAQRLLRQRREEEAGLLQQSDRRAAAAGALVLAAGLLVWLSTGAGALTAAVLSAGILAVPAAAAPHRGAVRSLKLRRETD